VGVEYLKTAIYIEDGRLQLVVTPENEFEKKALEMFQNKPIEAQVFFGSFYDCRGGWVRQTAYQSNYSSGDTSLMVRIVEPAPDFNPAKVIAQMKELTGGSTLASDVE
jgi:hypothetical protein